MKSIQLSESFGMLFVDEVSLIKEIAKLLPQSAVCINFGAGFGTSAIALIEERNDLSETFYSIDMREGGPFGGLENERNAFFDSGMIHLLPLQILGDSSAVGREWDGTKKIDYVFIDGDHFGEKLTEDINGWLPHLNIGGYVLFHDYESEHWDDVKEVIDRVIRPQMEFIKHSKTLIAFKKIDELNL